MRGRGAVDLGVGHRAQLLQEARHQLVIAQGVQLARLIQRPPTGVERGQLGLGFRVTRVEQLLRQVVAADLRERAHADQRLEEGVDYLVAPGGVERVLHVADAERSPYPHAAGGRHGEHRQGAGAKTQIGPVPNGRVTVPQRLQRRALGHRAGPRRHSTVEVEVVLPRQTPGTTRGERDHLRHQGTPLAVVLAAVGEPPLGLAEGRERL